MAQHAKGFDVKSDTEFDPWDPHGGKRGPTPEGWLLMSP